MCMYLDPGRPPKEILFPRNSFLCIPLNAVFLSSSLFLDISYLQMCPKRAWRHGSELPDFFSYQHFPRTW